MTEDVGRHWFDPYTPVPEPAEEKDQFAMELRVTEEES
jgi:hypothetical protein